MKQLLIVIGVVAGIILFTAVAVYFGGGLANPAAIDKGQRFKAKPGTTRKNAIALTSSARKETKGPEAAIARKASEMEDDSPLTVKSLSSSASKDPNRSGPAHDRAQQALNGVSPEAGIRSLTSALSLPHDPQQAAYIHEAMGQLYVQLDPPDYDKAAEAFAEARALSSDPEMEQSVLLKSVQVLMQGGRNDEARQALEEGFDAEQLSSETQFRLQVLRGQLEERAGRGAEAEALYYSVLDGTLELPESLEKDVAIALARGAALHLTRLYRDYDRDQAAEALAKDLKRRFKKIEESG